MNGLRQAQKLLHFMRCFFEQKIIFMSTLFETWYVFNTNKNYVKTCGKTCRISTFSTENSFLWSVFMLMSHTHVVQASLIAAIVENCNKITDACCPLPPVHVLSHLREWENILYVHKVPEIWTRAAWSRWEKRSSFTGGLFSSAQRGGAAGQVVEGMGKEIKLPSSLPSTTWQSVLVPEWQLVISAYRMPVRSLRHAPQVCESSSLPDSCSEERQKWKKMMCKVRGLFFILYFGNIFSGKRFLPWISQDLRTFPEFFPATSTSQTDTILK